MFQMIKWVLGAGFLFFVVAILIGTFLSSHEHYYICVANTGKVPATVTATLSEQKLTVEPGKDANLEVTGQQSGDKDVERTITLDAGGKKETFKTKVKYDMALVLDVTGDNCFVHADCSPLYASKKDKPGASHELKVEKTYKGQRLFL